MPFSDDSYDNPYINRSSIRTVENTLSGIDYQIDNNSTLKDLAADVNEIKKCMKILFKADEKTLKQYATLRDLYDQYKETYILIFGKDNE